MAIGAVVGGIIGAVSAAAGGSDAFSVVVAAATGAIGGLVSASGAGALAQTLVSAGLSMASNAATQIHGINSGVQKKFNYGDMILDGVVSGVTGARGGAAGASHGNTGGIKAATKQMFKRIHKGDGIRKAYAYYAKTAHAKGGTFVLHGLRDSLRKTANVGVFSAAKSRINSWRSRRLQ